MLALALGHQALGLLASLGVFRRLRLPPVAIATHAQPPGMRGHRLIHCHRQVVGLWRRIGEPLAVLEVGELQALGDRGLARREAVEIARRKLDPIKATALPTRGRAVDAVDLTSSSTSLNAAEQVDELGDKRGIDFA